MNEKGAIVLKVNGQTRSALCEARQSLLELLRDVLQLTGTKEGCNDGNCGACSVELDGTLVNSCCVLAVEANGCAVETVEGMAQHGHLDPLQQAFIDENALQCGFCTPGLLIAARALLRENKDPTEQQVREWLAGNLCRCTGYDKIVRAVLRVAHDGAMRYGAI
ncbi:MAG: (2Fe-2S)-binding protein [Steroidobacteraceae bacterium]